MKTDRRVQSPAVPLESLAVSPQSTPLVTTPQDAALRSAETDFRVTMLPIETPEARDRLIGAIQWLLARGALKEASTA